MSIAIISKLELFKLLEKNKRSIDNFIIDEAAKLIENQSNIKLQPAISDDLKMEIKSKFCSLRGCWSRLTLAERDKFPQTIQNQVYTIHIKAMDILPTTLEEQYDSCKSRLERVNKTNQVLESDNRILRAQIKVMNEQLVQKQAQAQTPATIPQPPPGPLKILLQQPQSQPKPGPAPGKKINQILSSQQLKLEQIPENLQFQLQQISQQMKQQQQPGAGPVRIQLDQLPESMQNQLRQLSQQAKTQQQTTPGQAANPQGVPQKLALKVETPGQLLVPIQASALQLQLAQPLPKKDTNNLSQDKNKIAIPRQNSELTKKKLNDIYTKCAIETGTKSLKRLEPQTSFSLEDEPKTKITKWKCQKRKNYFDCSYRQQNRIRKQIRQAVSECNDYLKTMGLCLNSVNVFPIELDEGDVKVNVKEQHEINEEDEVSKTNKLLYYKDKFGISDRAYGDLKTKCELDIPSLFMIKKRRQDIDHLFELHDNPKGVYISPKVKFTQRIEAYFDGKYGSSLFANNAIPENFNDQIVHIRIAADGTNIGRNLKLMNVTFIILNEGPRSRTANGNYTLGIYEIENENYDSCVICFKEIVEQITDLKEIEVHGQKIKLIFYYAGDWKMLAHCLGIQSANSKYPCVWCKCCKEDFTDKSIEWSITDPEKGARSHEELIKVVQLPNNAKTIKYGYDRLPIFKDIIPINRYMIDMLHLFLRISDTLINLLVKDCSLVDNFESWSISRFNVQDYKHLNAFQVFLNEECAVNFKFVWMSETKKLTWRDLVGPEKMRFFENFDLSKILPEHDKFDLVTKLWKEFYDIIKAIKMVEISADDLKQRTSEWLDLFLSIYNKTMVTPYIHAFVSHLHEFVALYKDINAFNLQGLERLNELSTHQYFRGTNKRETALHQMFKKRNRMEYLRLFIDDPDMML